MSSKKVLSDYLMTEECRKLQEEWEESNEKEIQIFNVEEDQIAETNMNATVLENDEFVPILQNECLENIELNGNPFEDKDVILQEDKANNDLNLISKDVTGSSVRVHNIIPDASNENLKMEEQCDTKLNIKEKRHISFKFWKCCRKKKKRDQVKNSAETL